MRILVVGANGQTGRRIGERLRNGPHEPVVMVRTSFDLLTGSTPIAEAPASL